MPSYMVTAINVGSFNLGEADRVLSIFTAEKGLLKAIAKGARKPGTKMAGRSDILCVNELLLSRGRTFEIITQAQTVDGFPKLRSDLSRLSYGLYYAELTNAFAQGLEEDSKNYLAFLIESLQQLSNAELSPVHLCLQFQLKLLDILGLKPELTYCIYCRDVLHEYNLSKFNVELGGIVCSACFQKGRQTQVSERPADHDQLEHEHGLLSRGVHITPMVWKTIVLADAETPHESFNRNKSPGAVSDQAQRLMQGYVEHKAGKRLKSLDLLVKFKEVNALKQSAES